jgi:hypothetical protein
VTHADGAPPPANGLEATVADLLYALVVIGFLALMVQLARMGMRLVDAGVDRGTTVDVATDSTAPVAGVTARRQP